MFVVKDGEAVCLNDSKSLLIRQMIASFLYLGTWPEPRSGDARDVRVVHQCLCLIQTKSMETARIDVRDCGAAYRFLMALLSVTSGRWFLTGTPRLLQRPIEPLVEALRSIGASIQRSDDGWLIVGKELHSEHLTVDCSQSSQFASALLLIGERIGLRELETVPETPPSASYIAMTRNVLADLAFGKELSREADWSTAAFWYTFVAASDKVNSLTLNNLKLDSLQGDSCVSELFKNLGVASEQLPVGVKISKMTNWKHTEKRIQWDMANHPDLVPVLAVSAILLSFDIIMENIENLNVKESRRLDCLVRSLSPFVSIFVGDENCLCVRGSSSRKTVADRVCLDTAGDHRMVMAFALLSLQNDIQLSDIECVEKSYPDFQNYFQVNKTIGK